MDLQELATWSIDYQKKEKTLITYNNYPISNYCALFIQLIIGYYYITLQCKRPSRGNPFRPLFHSFISVILLFIHPDLIIIKLIVNNNGNKLNGIEWRATVSHLVYWLIRDNYQVVRGSTGRRRLHPIIS